MVAFHRFQSRAVVLIEEISPHKVQNLSPRADSLYRMRLDERCASLFRASLPPAPGLTASLCSSGRGFAFRFFRLRLAATPYSATVAVIGSDWLLSSNKILPMLGHAGQCWAMLGNAGHTLRRVSRPASVQLPETKEAGRGRPAQF